MINGYDPIKDNESYFGLFSYANTIKVDELFASLGIRYEFRLQENVEVEILKNWHAWDESSNGNRTGYHLWILSEDIEKIGFQLSDLFPERDYMGRHAQKPS